MIGRPALRIAALALAVVAVVAGGTGRAAERGAVAFDESAAFRHVERLVAIGPRPAGSAASRRARDYIVETLRKRKIEVRVLPFDADTPHGRLAMANIMAVLPGRRPDAILIGGHYDTKWFRELRFVGANDGGSSTALLLELARALAGRAREYTYWITWFDGEEAGEAWTATDSLYGSRHLAGELRASGRLPRAVIVADMIGDRQLNILRDGYSTPWLMELIWATARRLGHGEHFMSQTSLVEDDHVPFLRVGVPAALLIDFDFLSWHTADDTLDKVSARSLGIVGRVLLETLPALEGALSRTSGPAPDFRAFHRSPRPSNGLRLAPPLVNAKVSGER